MNPIPVTLSLPEILEGGCSARVLLFNQGIWEIGRLMELGGGEPPMWILDDEQSVEPDVNYWMPLPETPREDQKAAKQLQQSNDAGCSAAAVFHGDDPNECISFGCQLTAGHAGPHLWKGEDDNLAENGTYEGAPAPQSVQMRWPISE